MTFMFLDPNHFFPCTSTVFTSSRTNCKKQKK